MKIVVISSFFILIFLNCFVSSGLFSFHSSTTKHVESSEVKLCADILSQDREIDRLEMLLKKIGVTKILRITIKRLLYTVGAAKARSFLKHSGYLREEKSRLLVDKVLPLLKEKGKENRLEKFYSSISKQSGSAASSTAHGYGHSTCCTGNAANGQFQTTWKHEGAQGHAQTSWKHDGLSTHDHSQAAWTQEQSMPHANGPGHGSPNLSQGGHMLPQYSQPSQSMPHVNGPSHGLPPLNQGCYMSPAYSPTPRGLDEHVGNIHGVGHTSTNQRGNMAHDYSQTSQGLGEHMSNIHSAGRASTNQRGQEQNMGNIHGAGYAHVADNHERSANFHQPKKDLFVGFTMGLA